MSHARARIRARKRYGTMHILFDFVLTILTSGLWLVWIIIRYLRNNS